MYWFKKIIRAILNLLPVFALSLLFTNNTFAYKYDINVLPINVIPEVNNGGSGTNQSGFGLEVSKDANYLFYLASTDFKFYPYGTNFSNGCTPLSETGYLPILVNETSSTYRLNWGVYGITPNQPLPDSWSISPCLDVSNRVPWSGFYQNDTDSSNGLHAQTKFGLDSIFGVDNYPNQIYNITVPLGTQSRSSIDNLSSSSTFEFTGEFVIDFDDPVNSGLTNNSDVLLLVTYIHSDLGRENVTSSCSVNVTRDDPNDPNSVWSVSYSCPYTVQSLYLYDDPLLQFSIKFIPSYSNNNTKFYNLIYDSSSVITDGNSAPASDSWGDQHIYGTNPDQAPGSAKQVLFPDIESDGFNWSQSLIQLFGFTFLNPFAPLFEMFSNNDSCAQIPTLAGLIHSESTEVCPWFSSSVRNIATPVLTISSMMLIFGFTVRWLGSRSGNFIEDSGGVESGGYSFANKFRRKG